MEPIIILFNAPPRAGKDTAADYICDKINKNNNYVTAHRLSFAEPLKVLTHMIYLGKQLPALYFDDIKDMPLEDFGGISPRKAYQIVSEEVIKPYYGKDYFGRIVVKKIKEYLINTTSQIQFIISDCGFPEEVEPLIEAFSPQAIQLVHIEREGCNYNEDTRRNLTHPYLSPVTLKNNTTLENFYKTLDNEFGL